MNYLLDRKNKRFKILRVLTILLFLFLFIYFSRPIFGGLSRATLFIFKPFYILSENLGNKFSELTLVFYSKVNLEKENENLKNNLTEIETRLLNYEILEKENLELKEILGRKSEKKEMLLANILTEPNQNIFDVLLIDVGEKNGVKNGDLIFAFGNIPIGRVIETYNGTAKVLLFSSSGQKTEVVISSHNTFMSVIGRGGGNFEMNLPRDFSLEVGTEILWPGLIPYVMAKVETIISDPRDSFQKAILVSPINILELKSVQVEI